MYEKYKLKQHWLTDSKFHQYTAAVVVTGVIYGMGEFIYHKLPSLLNFECKWSVLGNIVGLLLVLRLIILRVQQQQLQEQDKPLPVFSYEGTQQMSI